jgi:ribulose-phosphate 3-epimerase
MGATIQTLSGLPANRLLAEFSLWSADLVRIADDVARVDSFVDIYHADVADGHFHRRFCCFPT